MKVGWPPLALGFLGLFIGPTLIAVAFTLLNAWRGVAAAHSPAH
jgi:predicted PurR-regulated permease PerM